MAAPRSLKSRLEEVGEVANFDWSRLKVQEDFLLCDDQFTVYSGGFGTGKTTVLCAKLIWLLSIPNNFGYLARQDGKALRASTIQALVEMLPGEYIAKKNDQQGFIQLKSEFGGSKLAYGDVKDLRDLKNLPLGFFAIDQMEEVSLQVWEYLVGRLRRKNPVVHESGLKQYWVHGHCQENTAPGNHRHLALEGDLSCRLCGWKLPEYSEKIPGRYKYPIWELICHKRYGFGVCNPEGPSHWIFTHFSGLPGEKTTSQGLTNYRGFHATAWDGMSAGFTDPIYVSDMEHLYKHSPLMWQRYLEGKWVEAEGLVYPGWRRDQHLLEVGATTGSGTPVIDEHAPIFEWIDHGLTAPTAVGWVIVQRCRCGCQKYNYFLVDEHYVGNVPVSYHCNRIKVHRARWEGHPLQATYLDSQAFSKTLMGGKGTARENELYSVADEYLDHDILCLPNQKNWDAGYNRITEILTHDPDHLHPVTGERGAPHFFVFANCVKFVEEIENYRWKKVRNVLQPHTEEPQDGKDDHMDALNGFLTSRPEDIVEVGRPRELIEDEDPGWLKEIDSFLDTDAYAYMEQ